MIETSRAQFLSRGFKGGVALVAGGTVLSLAQHKVQKQTISVDRARSVALKKYPGKVVKQPLLEHEDGKLQYEVIVKTGKTLHEVNVDAYTGKIVSVEKVTAKEEAKEKAISLDPYNPQIK